MEQNRLSHLRDDELEGEVRYEGARYPRSVTRYVRRQIRKWIEIHEALFSGEVSRESKPRYYVVLSREREGHWVQCYLELRVGDRVWKSFWVGPSLHQALIHSLNQCMSRSIPLGHA